MAPERISKAEAGRRLGFNSAVPVARLIRDGRIKTTTFLGREYVDAGSLDALLAEALEREPTGVAGGVGA